MNLLLYYDQLLYFILIKLLYYIIMKEFIIKVSNKIYYDF